MTYCLCSIEQGWRFGENGEGKVWVYQKGTAFAQRAKKCWAAVRAIVRFLCEAGPELG